MKKMKRFLVTLLSSLTAIACIAGITACNDKKEAATDSASNPSYNITFGDGNDCAHEYEYKRFDGSSCEEKGVAVLACTKCGKTVGDPVPVDPVGHKIAKIEAVADTCTEAGIEEHYECTACGQVSDDAKNWRNTYAGEFVKDDLKGHTFGTLGEDCPINTAKVPADCDTDGHTSFAYCTVCATNAMNEDAYKALAYKYADDDDELTKAREAYLMAEGKVALFGYEVIPATHTMSWVLTDNTPGVVTETNGKALAVKDYYIPADDEDCSSEGYKNYQICSACCGEDADVWEAVEEAMEEKEPETIAEAVAILKECGVIMSDVEVIKSTTGHTHYVLDENGNETAESVMVKGKPANCTENGYEWSYTCTRCGEAVNANKVIEAKGHTYDKNAKATCTADVKCSVCDAVIEEKLDHDLVAVEDKEATCTTDGWEDKAYCKVCGYETMTVVKAYQHTSWTAIDWEDYDVANCYVGTLKETDAGKYFECDECGVWAKVTGTNNDKLTVIDDISTVWDKKPLAHSYDDPETTDVVEAYVAATCVADAQNYECVLCGEITACAEDAIYATGIHTYTGTGSVKPTCTTDGKCSVCKEVIEGSALAHEANGEATWTKLYDYKAPTCTEAGILESYYCTQCKDIAVIVDGDMITEIELMDGIVVDMGSYSASATNKGVNKDYVVLAKLGHNVPVDEEGNVIKNVEAKNATCTEAGNYAYTACLNCGVAVKADGTEDKTNYVIEAKGHGSNDATHCYMTCDKAYAAEWVDANENGIWDNGEEVLEWTGCGEYVENSKGAHSYDKNNECIICNKKKA